MKLRFAVAALTALGAVALGANAASAMPNGLPQASQIATQSANIDQVRYVCNRWGHCWWRPGWRSAYGFYGPYRWHGPGWHRWHHWRRW